MAKSLDFLNGSLEDNNNYCRNPDNANGGPWCFVKDPITNNYEQEYCFIPFCGRCPHVLKYLFRP